MNNNQPQWIVFDVGGVLLDWFSSSKKFAQGIGIPHTELLEAFHAQYGLSTIDTLLNTGRIEPQEAWDIVLSKFNKPPIDIEQIIADWCYAAYWNTEVLQLMDEIKEANYPIAILSNSWFSFNNPQRRHLFSDRFNYCEYIFDSAEIGIMKPDQRIYGHVEETLNAKASEILFIDDSPNNLKTAESRGWSTLLFNSRSGKIGIEKSVEKIQVALASGISQ